MASRPKTGERRRTRQPLKIDKLPAELHERIQRERAAGATWEEIEEMSPRFDEWAKVPAAAQLLFVGHKLPHTTLQRWYDLRVEQVKKEMLADAERAREIAAIFAGRAFKDLPEAVRNALGDKIFSLMQSADEKTQSKLRKELLELGFLLAQQRKLDIQDKKVAAETKRVDLLVRDFEMRKRKFDDETDKAARKLGKGKPITTDDINRIRERTFGLPPIAAGRTAA